MNISEIRDAFKQKKEEVQQSELQEKAEEQPTESWLDSITLSEVVRGISEVCEPYVERFYCEVHGLKISPLCLHLKLPPPAFFFIEHGSPFILSLLSEEPKGKTKSRQELYEYHVRTCCAAITEPAVDIDLLRKLPEWFIQRLYNFIINTIAPTNIVALMRVFHNEVQQKASRNQILDIYLMARGNNSSPLEYLFPDYLSLNPYVKGALEHIIFEVGNEYDRKCRDAELQIMAGVSTKKNFSLFG